MDSNKTGKNLGIFIATSLFSLATIQSASAQPGTLATAPLFLSTAVEPNMFFSVDDSGSMKHLTLMDNPTAGYATDAGSPFIKIDNTYERLRNFFPEWYSEDIPPANGLHPEWDKHWAVFNWKGNHLYYNPGFEYTPWPGVDASGNAMYEDADPTAVQFRPWDPTAKATINITTNKTVTHRYEGTDYTTTQRWYPTYFVWEDTNTDSALDGNGVLDQTDTHSKVNIAVGSAQMQNFANWMQYWSTRMHAAKAVLGNIINQADATRMGMNWFNDSAHLNLASMTDEAAKRTLLNELYTEVPNGGTPTRLTIRKNR